MFKRLFMGLTLVISILFSCTSAFAQSVCPLNGTSSSKLVCVIPQVYGPFGLGSGATAPLLADGHEAHFEGDFLSSFGPINEAVGIQVSQLPIVSPPAYVRTGREATLWCSVDYNILNASIGLKYQLWRNLVITGNVLVKLDDSRVAIDNSAPGWGLL
jgi:hypothetical protein